VFLANSFWHFYFFGEERVTCHSHAATYVRVVPIGWGGLPTENIWNSWEERPQLILSFLGMRSVSADRFFLYASSVSWHIAEKRSWVSLKLSLVCMFVCLFRGGNSESSERGKRSPPGII
jgi:hypothetical protein